MSATAGRPNPWIGRPRFGLPQPTDSAVRLFCFTPAGAGPTTYTQNAWAELPPSIEIMPVLLPGRAQRLAESPLRSVEEMAAGALKGLRSMLAERPYALFGHSLGASVALEFARLIAAEASVPQPVHLIVSARLPHGSLKGAADTGGASLVSGIADDREFVAAIHGKYGTLQMVLDNPELMEMVLPMMRADFGAAEAYTLVPLASPLTVPISALGGELDVYSMEQLETWSELTVDFRGVTILDGAEHMFVGEPPPPMCELLVRTLTHA